MIILHKLNGTEFVLNAELIETLESQGSETIVCLATGNKFAVRESAAEITARVLDYRRAVQRQSAASGKPVNPISGFTREEP